MSTDVFDDLAAEEACIEAVLATLSTDDWRTGSGAAGWTIADVVLHLAQSEETVVLTTAGGLVQGSWQWLGASVDEAMAERVRRDSTRPEQVFDRWRSARRAALAALRQADPDVPLNWVAAELKPRTLGTTRLAEHWAHALDITSPLGIDYPDTDRLRHIAWLGHRSLPYALARAGAPMVPVRCELTGPDGTLWTFGPADAQSRISGPASAFCRVGAQRVRPDESGLQTEGPYGPVALRHLRNYAA
jgi:uncharacterized protein (TIGR03084 family)